jgi:hypothetical protein
MKRRSLACMFSLLLTAHCSLLTVFAEEGMWIPMLLQQLNITQMQTMGLKLSAEDIYSINHSSMKDAIVLFGRGCTGVIVSGEGLLLTNHHCGYGSVQALSSLENDYLANGFWAEKRSDELPAKGLSVTLLVRMEDVTENALQGVAPGMTEQQRTAAVKTNIAAIEKESVTGTDYEARVRPFYYGNRYYLFITEVFKDIRLVGAPPSSIGKFGGDTDNWMWPRHTGDFSVFRIYAGKDNKPAQYSSENVPYKPKYSLPVSIKGYSKGDFTFVFGYPGTTREYIPARGMEIIACKENPVRVGLRQKRLDIIGGAMDTNRLIALQYAAKYAGIANYWKKMIGESREIRHLDAIAVKQKSEAHFILWANSDGLRQANYGALLGDFGKTYDRYEPLSMVSVYLNETATAPEIVRLAGSYQELVKLSQQKDPKKETLEKEILLRKEGARDFYKNYNAIVDRRIMTAMLPELQKHVPAEMLPGVFAEIDKKYHGEVDGYVADLYTRSIFADSAKLYALLSSYKSSDVKKILKDPGFIYTRSTNERLNRTVAPQLQQLQAHLDSLQRIYIAAQMEMQKERRFYPDANSTLRISYGKVDDYSPADGVTYSYFTTTDGILAKEDPGICDYAVDPKLKALLTARDFGRFADADGTLHVAFTATNHTTGGNSGSPVLNAEGQLLGLNFDRNWEGTMSDLFYDPAQCRNITLDIRYCLFIMDKYAGAGHLVNEMTVVE